MREASVNDVTVIVTADAVVTVMVVSGSALTVTVPLEHVAQ